MTEELTEDQKTELFIEWMKRPVTLTPKKAKNLISDLEETIIELRSKLKDSSRFEKNMIYNQIENRQTQIKYARTFL
jgi:TFIIF-interacting CTD phosphatase-like protein